MANLLRHRRLLAVLAVATIVPSSCGGGSDSSSVDTTVVVAKNSAFKKAGSKPGAGNATTTTVGSAAAALNGVGREYRNSSGQVVDGLGNVVTALPTAWPNALGADALGLVAQEAERQLVGAKDPLKQQAEAWKSASATEVEGAANALLSKYSVKWPKLPIGGGSNMEFAPVASPVTVKVQAAQWTGSVSMNLLVSLNFMGVRTYQTQIGCLSLAGGGTSDPAFTFTGSC